MNMLKKIAFAFLLGALTVTAALAGNAPLMTQWDPTNALGSINAWIQSYNLGTGGVVATLPAPVSTAGTSIETDFAYTIPAGYLSTGNTFHVKAYGANDGNANARTLTFSFGGSTCVLTVTGTSATWTADFWVTETGSKTQTSQCVGQQGTSALAPVQASNWTVDNTANIAVLVRQTAATDTGGMTLKESWMDFMR
jgi:hypothetical protein